MFVEREGKRTVCVCVCVVCVCVCVWCVCVCSVCVHVLRACVCVCVVCFNYFSLVNHYLAISYYFHYFLNRGHGSSDDNYFVLLETLQILT